MKIVPYHFGQKEKMGSQRLLGRNLVRQVLRIMDSVSVCLWCLVILAHSCRAYAMPSGTIMVTKWNPVLFPAVTIFDWPKSEQKTILRHRKRQTGQNNCIQLFNERETVLQVDGSGNVRGTYDVDDPSSKLIVTFNNIMSFDIFVFLLCIACKFLSVVCVCGGVHNVS